MCNSKYQQLHQLSADHVHPGMTYDQVMEMAQSPDVSTQMISGQHEDRHIRTLEAKLADGRWLQINERPLICSGCGRSSSSSMVGATSARVPPLSRRRSWRGPM